MAQIDFNLPPRSLLARLGEELDALDENERMIVTNTKMDDQWTHGDRADMHS